MIKQQVFIGFLASILLIGKVIAQTHEYPYQNPKISKEDRVKDLLSRMTLEEKIDQLSMKSLKDLKMDENGQVTSASLEALFNGGSIGCLESPFIEHDKIAQFSEAADRYLRENTRLGIPAIQIAECLHGQMALGATIFPQAISQGSTWNPELVFQMAEVIAGEASSSGVDQALSPLFDLARDPRYGRLEECYGEDVHLVSRMGVAFVTGVQGAPEVTKTHIPDDYLMATAKHFVGYSVPQAGINIAPAIVGERELRSRHLVPFEAAVKEANIYSIMPGYHEVDGVPVHASDWLLTDILRKEWGFEGYVFSDYTAINMLEFFHGVSQSKKETAHMALTAGVELEAPSRYAYGELKALVESGEMDKAVLDQAVGRVLLSKFRAGLFDKPYIVPADIQSKIRKKESVALARKMAEESIILLKNDNNLLPLKKEALKSIAVIGPNGDQVQFGDYSVTKSNDYGVTLLEGIKSYVGTDVKVNYARGCGITDLDKSGFEEAVKLANESDVVVLAVGSTSIIYSGIGWGNDQLDRHNTSGEGLDRTSLEIPGVQPELIKEIQATGKSIVLVMIHGRPYSINWEKENIPAILDAWYPGEEGGNAIANILFGEANPSGKLTVSVPRSAGHIPAVYDHKPSAKGYYKQRGTLEKPGRDYVFSTPDPLFEFGYGLSYTTFDYSDLKIKTPHLENGESVKFSVKVKNTGDLKGKEVVQVYVRDKISSITTPVKLLKAFQKPELEPGEDIELEFEIPYEELSLWNQKMEKVVEPGVFEIQVGSSSQDIRLRGEFEVK
ncbi:glycoside hydrolase family 3 N-terminal domain-containing protein [Echinicola salinicaeni]|uniref:glycoside hydrolase family 3 N-terminal domain-containing protein n=1 Tax=Echinicola salinicaeni TaxID=2762757 RepID=UPI0016448B95|nr:glycoside hydrolase family 3 N-terminal domain-containing protein [Echinicola salinicaeni]